MNYADYIDWDEGRDFATPVVEFLDCKGCGKSTSTLTHVPEFDFMGCAECVKECAAVIASENYLEQRRAA